MAMHNRDWNIKTYTDLDELCKELCRDITWTLCTGFRWQNVVLVNDSFSEDSLQEFAMVIVEEGKAEGKQLDSITVSWCKPDRLAEIIRDAINGKYETSYGTVELGVHEGECDLCM